MAAAATRQRAAAPQPSPKRRPELEVIERSNRVRRARPIVVLAIMAAAAVAFGSLVVQISMINRQQQLDSIRTEISRVQEDNKSLRQREGRLQSSSEILRIAEEELGMVKAKQAELVIPAQRSVGATGDADVSDAASTLPGGEG